VPFECKKYHCECKARCCGIVPIPVVTWQKNQHNIQKPVLYAHKVLAQDPHTEKRETSILPVTEEMLCPFLKEDLSCAIYQQRPEICKKFGDETHLMLCCPVQKADGTPRTENEKEIFEQQINEFFSLQKEENEKQSKMQIVQ
jgi:Fe-S-cluster containining protein